MTTHPLRPNQHEYWATTNTPLLDEAGEVTAILCQPVNISELVMLRGQLAQADASNPVGPLTLDLLGLLNAERERFNQLFEQAPGFVCILCGPNHVFELANDAYYQLVGHRQIIGHILAEVLPEVVEQGFLDKLNRVYATGEPFIARAIPIELQRAADGVLEERFIDLTYQPILDAGGSINGIFVQGHDVTEAHWLSQEVTFQAAHDALTGLFNRREVARQMAKSRISESDILEAARISQGIERLDQIKFAILEKNGQISVIPKE